MTPRGIRAIATCTVLVLAVVGGASTRTPDPVREPITPVAYAPHPATESVPMTVATFEVPDGRESTYGEPITLSATCSRPLDVVAGVVQDHVLIYLEGVGAATPEQIDAADLTIDGATFSYEWTPPPEWTLAHVGYLCEAGAGTTFDPSSSSAVSAGVFTGMQLVFIPTSPPLNGWQQFESIDHPKEVVPGTVVHFAVTCSRPFNFNDAAVPTDHVALYFDHAVVESVPSHELSSWDFRMSGSTFIYDWHVPLDQPLGPYDLLVACDSAGDTFNYWPPSRAYSGMLSFSVVRATNALPSVE